MYLKQYHYYHSLYKITDLDSENLYTLIKKSNLNKYRSLLEYFLADFHYNQTVIYFTQRYKKQQICQTIYFL